MDVRGKPMLVSIGDCNSKSGHQLVTITRTGAAESGDDKAELTVMDTKPFEIVFTTPEPVIHELANAAEEPVPIWKREGVE
jgi:hypothetical protein